MERIGPKYFLLMAAMACTKTTAVDDASVGDTAQESSSRTCDVTVRETIPATGSMDHYYLDPIVFVMSAPIEEAEVVTNLSGTTTISDDGRTVTFAPSGVLSPSTEYTIGLDYCYGQPEITFTTSHYGAPIESIADLQGRAFNLNFGSGTYTVGENAGDLLNAVFTRDVLVQFEAVRDVDARIVAAVGEPNATTIGQDLCGRTIAVNASMQALPLVSGQEVNFIFGAMGGQIRVDYIDFEATLSSDLETIGGLTYTATIGMAELVDMLPEFGGEEVGCDLAENLGIPCAPCGNMPSEQCITISAKGIDGNLVDIAIEEISEMGAHPDCDMDEQ